MFKNKKNSTDIVVSVHMADADMRLVKSESIPLEKWEKFVMADQITNYRCQCKIVKIVYDMDNDRFSLELETVWTNDRKQITWYSNHLDDMFPRKITKARKKDIE